MRCSTPSTLFLHGLGTLAISPMMAATSEQGTSTWSTRYACENMYTVVCVKPGAQQAKAAAMGLHQLCAIPPPRLQPVTSPPQYEMGWDTMVALPVPCCR